MTTFQQFATYVVGRAKSQSEAKFWIETYRLMVDEFCDSIEDCESAEIDEAIDEIEDDIVVAVDNARERLERAGYDRDTIRNAIDAVLERFVS